MKDIINFLKSFDRSKVYLLYLPQIQACNKVKHESIVYKISTAQFLYQFFQGIQHLNNSISIIQSNPLTI